MKEKKKKLPFGITEEFISEVDTMDTLQRKLKIATLENQEDQSRTFLKENEAVQKAKDELDYIAGPAKDAIKTLKNRKKYLLEELKKSGAIE